jgi:SAM-dependent methyltransferase
MHETKKRCAGGESATDRLPDSAEALVGKVRERYGEIAEGRPASCCAPAERIGYDARELESAPDGANLSLGCGAPISHLELKPGEVVLDLGSGGGLDVFLAAEKVGPSGRVIGIDMTPRMIERARQNARSAGLDQVEFRQGRLEALPVEDASIDAVTSNCVINLVPDKSRVFVEVHRVLKPGGRLVVSDIVLDGRLPEALERDLMAYVGCVAGAVPREAYFRTVEEAGLRDITVLRDVDFLAGVAPDSPEEVTALCCRTGVGIEEVAGKVRSITFRAEKA